MSEDSIQINGAVQVIKLLIIGLLYMAILFVIADNLHGRLFDHATFIYLTNSFSAGLTEYGDNAKVILIGSIIFLSIVSGMMINDIARKFSIISIILLLVITMIDFVPLKIIIDG